MKLRTYLPDLNCNELNEILLDRKEDLIVDRLCTKLSDINSICKRLQQDSTNFFDLRALFNTVIDHNLETADRLSCDETVLQNPVFENAIVKLQVSQLHDLSGNEFQIVKWF